jgi:hypothetical protein
MTEAHSSGASFSIKEAIGFGFKPGASAFALLLVAHYVFLGVPQILCSFLPHMARMLPLMLINSLFIGGLWVMSLKVVDGEQPSFADALSRIKDFWKYFLANLIYTVAVCLSLLFLILPGFAVMTLLCFYTLSLTEGATLLGCFKESIDLVKGNFGGVLGFFVVLVSAMIGIGLVLFLVVVLTVVLAINALHVPHEPTVPIFVALGLQPLSLVSQLALAHAYRQLTRMQEVG